MIGLEDETDMLPPDLRELVRTCPAGGGAANADNPIRRGKHAAENRQEGSLAAAGGAHQYRQFAGIEGYD